MYWSELIFHSLKSVNHLKVLESLYEKPLLMKKIRGVNYKTTARIIKQLVKQGLISNNKGLYSLTNLGLVITCFLTGKFNELKPEIKTEFILDKDKPYVERKEFIEEVLYSLERKRSTLILGETGAGKTTLLNHLQSDYLKNSVMANSKPASQVIEKLAVHLSVKLTNPKGRRKRIFELLDEVIKKSPEDLIIIIDEVEEATKQTRKIIKILQRSGLTILSAGTESRGINFQSELKLRRLNKEEAGSLINQLLKDSGVNSELSNELVKIGNPERLKQACNDLIITNKMGELENKDKIVNFRKELRNKQLKIINLISTYDLINIAYLLITLRYFFYGQKQYHIGYLLSSLAYMIFFIFRRRKKK